MSASQTMQAVSHVYPLPRCDVSLYASGDGYSKGSLVWSAKQVDNLRVGESFTVVKQYSTGLPYPERHHTEEEHRIVFDAVWNVSVMLLQRGAGNPGTGRNAQYVLEITWKDASLSSGGGNNVVRTYYGVMLPAQELSSRDGNEFTESTTLSAKYFEQS